MRVQFKTVEQGKGNTYYIVFEVLDGQAGSEKVLFDLTSAAGYVEEENAWQALPQVTARMEAAVEEIMSHPEQNVFKIFEFF